MEYSRLNTSTNTTTVLFSELTSDLSYEINGSDVNINLLIEM